MRGRFWATTLGIFALATGPRAGIAATYYVAVDAAGASDANAGSAEQPFKTLARAVKDLKPGDAVLVRAGIYRESAEIKASGTAEQPITIAAAPGDEGKVIITGSDAVKEWKKLSPIVYTAPWTLDLQSHYPPEWIAKTAVGDYGPYAKRCEMIFLNGKPVRQVLATGLMERNTFAVDETRHVLRLALPDGSTPTNDIEVSVRQTGLSFRGDHLRILGLTVEHVANGYFAGALSVRGDDNVIEGNTVRWNNLDGLYVSGKRVRIAGNVSNNNGQTGMSLTIWDSRIEGNETDDNSWRYGPGWAEGGIKMIGGRPTGNVISRHVAKGNRGAGIWLDTCGGGNRVEHCRVEGNMIAGIEFENCLGSNAIVDNVCIATRQIPNALYPEGGGAGVLLYESGDMTIDHNTLVDNEHAGIIFAGGQRPPDNAYCANEVITNNIFSGNAAGAITFWVRAKAATAETLATYKSEGNFWNQPAGRAGVYPTAPKVETLAEWQKLTGLDADSMSGDPMFTDPAAKNFRLKSDSPAAGKGAR